MKVTTNLDAGYVEAQIPLFSASPFLYGDELVVYQHPIGTGVGLEYALYGQRVNPAGEPVLSYGTAVDTQDPISNSGNAVAYPQVIVTGDFPSGFQVSAGGRSVVWPHATFPGAPVVIDMSGSIWVGTENQTHRAGLRQWISVPPGATVFPEFTPLQFGTGWAEWHIRPTYM
ncbi:hypothetical protein CJ197_14630 [Brachybacterium sp. UMB0905]|nr:hypothetical protein CJ197_14630 [Brachybacterium sp. UMB0905]